MERDKVHITLQRNVALNLSSLALKTKILSLPAVQYSCYPATAQLLMMKSWPYHLLQLIQFTKKQFGMSNTEARLSYITMQHEDKIDIIIFQHITLCSDNSDIVPYLKFSSGVNENEGTAISHNVRNTHLTTQLNIPAGSNLLL
jgi:hypothetical protein